MLPKSIRWKIQAWHGFLLVVLVTALMIGFYSYERRTLLSEVDNQLHELITPLLPRVTPMGPPPRPREFNGAPEGPDRRPPPPDEFERRDFSEMPSRGDRPPQRDDVVKNFANGKFYLVTWSPQKELKKSSNAPAQIPYPLPDERGLRTRGEFRELLRRLPNNNLVLMGISTAEIQKQLARLAFWLSGAGLTVIAIGLIGGWWLAGSALRPIAEISDAAGKIFEGDLSKRINVTETESELGQLAGVLNQTFARLEKSFQQQVRFTADASHELRTPISVILMQIQLALSRERSGEDYRQTLETCERAAERMRVLVNSLLELARIDSGEFELFREPCDLGRIAQDALDLIEPLAKNKNVTLSHSLEPIKISADCQKIGQVLINLLTNAIQHNAEGIQVSLSVQRSENRALIRIADNGVGISPNALPHLFERFYRVDKSRSRSKGSNGLGLAISKAIIEAHGGTIRAQSKPDEGTEFLVELPLEEISQS